MMQKSFGWPSLHVLCFCLALWGSSVCLQAAEGNRRVLGLYDSTEPYAPTASMSNVHKYLEMPLNRLGMVVEYADVNQRPLPDLSAYRAIAIWFTDNKINNPPEICKWLADAMAAGTKVILLDGVNFALSDLSGKTTSASVLTPLLRGIGLKLDESIEDTSNPFVLASTFEKKEGFQYETRQPPEGVYYECFRAENKSLQIWKTCLRTDVTNSQSVMVATSSRGGWVAAQEHAVRILIEPEYRVFWDLNPFAFLEDALGCSKELRPDVTTAFGARAAFSHIDADGMMNMTMDIPGKKRPASAVVHDEILSSYPVPVTVGLIVARVDPDAAGKKEYLPLWRKIMARPNVQPGCHAYTHPLNWAKGVMAIPVKRQKRFSEYFETVEAMEYLRQHVLPQGKRVEIFLWTGDCAPRASAVKLVKDYGALDINGGDPRLDTLSNSITYLPALTRPLGDTYQVFAAACNEYIYTDGWTENYGGFANVVQTFKHTESPVRFLPVNIYYHFYSGERRAALAALKSVYDWAVAKPLCWIHATEYVRTVHATRQMRTGRMDDGTYWVENYADLLTMRLDRTAQNVAMDSAKNILGFTHHAGSLYVSLAPGARASFRLTDAPVATMCLRESTSFLKNVRRDGRRWLATARLYAPGRLLLQGAAPGSAHKVTVGAQATTVQADNKGYLSVALPQGWGEWVEVSVGP